MTRYFVVLATLLIAQPALAQTLDVTGDAAIMVMPDRGASYGRGRSSGYGQMSQNVVQNIGSGSSGIGADGTVALGKISVTATVSVSYRMQPQ